MEQDDRKTSESLHQKDLRIQYLENELANRRKDRCIVFSEREREMMTWALKYFLAENETERDRVNRSMHKSWDKDFVLDVIERLNKPS